MCADPMRGTPLSQDLDRGDGFEKDVSRIYLLTYNFYLSANTRAGRDTGVIQGAAGGRDTTHDQRPASNSNAKPYARPYVGY